MTAIPFTPQQYAVSLSDLLDRLGASPDEGNPDSWRALCPVHEVGRDDVSSPSLLIDVFEHEDGSGHFIKVCCQSRRCESKHSGAHAELLAEAGITVREAMNVKYVGQARRGGKKRERATGEQRRSLEVRAQQNAFALRRKVDEGDEPIRALLAREFGVSPEHDFERLGLGYESRVDSETGEVTERLTVATYRLDGHVAWLQWRAIEDGKPVGKWVSAPNLNRGTDEEVRYDGPGIIGGWRGTGPVLIAEGASDGIALAALGTYDVLTSRGTPFGRLIDDARDALIGRDIVVIADNDDAGEDYTRTVIAATDAYVASAAWVRWGNEVKGYDVRDFRAEAPGAFSHRLARLIDGAERVYRKGSGFDAKPYAERGDEGTGAAIRDYVRHLGYDVAHTEAAGWMFYDRTRWVHDPKGRILIHLAGRLGREFRQALDDEQRAALAEAMATVDVTKSAAVEKVSKQIASRMQPFYRFAAGLGNVNAVNAGLTATSGHPTVVADIAEFDADPDVLAVANGVVELRTGVLREMRASDKITHRIPIAYNPQAKAPQFEKFLRDVLVTPDMETDEELVAYIKRLIGYGVTGSSAEQSFWVMYDPVGGSGKSQFFDILRGVFGPVVGDASFDLFEKTHLDNGDLSSLAAMRHARIMLASEGNGTKIAEGTLKKATGEDSLDAKFMRQNIFKFKARFALMLATNKMPKFGTTAPIWRRVKIVHWNRHFRDHEVVQSIGKKIVEAEAEGILALAVAEAGRWYAEGMPPCDAVERDTEDERSNADVLREFLAYNVHESGDFTEGTVLLGDLWRRLVLWYKAVGVDPFRDSEAGWPKSDVELRDYLTAQWGLPVRYIRETDAKGRTKIKRERGNGKPTRWKGRRLILAAIVNERFNRDRMDVLGVEDFANAGYVELFLPDDVGPQKYGGRLPGLDPYNPEEDR